jgi:predicted glycogen debranching enzyme
VNQPRLSSSDLPLLSLDFPQAPTLEEGLHREWLVTNGLGGYACGTLALCPTRKYHALFVPALERYGRTVMLGRMEEEVHLGQAVYRLDVEERADGSLSGEGHRYLRGFRLRGLFPEWDYAFGESTLRRTLTLVHRENTLYVSYLHLGGPPLELRLRPYPSFRRHDDSVDTALPTPMVRVVGDHMEMSTEGVEAPPLRLKLYGPHPSHFIRLPVRSPPLMFRVEKQRGYPYTAPQESPGYFQCRLMPGEVVSLGATVEGWEVLERAPEEPFRSEMERQQFLLSQAPVAAQQGVAARLVLAADQFIIEPKARPKDEAWARAAGQDARSIIAGYPWFTDWGRDTMISLEGMALCTGRSHEAGAILRTFQHYVKEGLLPNLFPEGESEGLYHTADATLWFFHAIDRYLSATSDTGLLRDLYPTLESIAQHHLRGTRFNIGVDASDGLLRQGMEGYQLTWMDAKVDGWVVTPRRGKAVEINALWFNALMLMAEWARQLGKDGTHYAAQAERARSAFNLRFWNPSTGCLFDVVDGEFGDDASVRPNQIFALSLRYPVLQKDRWQHVLDKVRSELLTPVGLRTLSPSHPHFKATYDGDLRARDSAYHQGTVWAWLLGHYLDASLRVEESKEKARGLLSGLSAHLEEGCVGQVSEIFDAAAPHHPRGCVAQAWSVAEMLRAWLNAI